MNLTGIWHLLAEGQDEIDIPSHRMDLRFVDEPGRFRAAILNRVNSEEMLIENAAFNGEVLTLQVQAPADVEDTDAPTLEMRVTGEKLVGRWVGGRVPSSPALKLVRVRPGFVPGMTRAAS